MVIKASSYVENKFTVAGRFIPWADVTMLMLMRVRRPDFKFLPFKVNSKSEVMDMMVSATEKVVTGQVKSSIMCPMLTPCFDLFISTRNFPPNNTMITLAVKVDVNGTYTSVTSI